MKKEIDKKLLRRLKIVEGQVRGLQKMIKDEKYCIDVITQTSAVKRALSSIEDVLLEGHLSTCLVEKIKSNNKTRAKKALAEILDIYKVAKKK